MKICKILIAVTVLFSACKSVKYADLENGLYADLQTNRGDILIKLHEKEVPMTVANFVALAEGDNTKVIDSLKGKPFYDGTKFHRVINDFMIQGGDITSTGRGDNGYRFGDEFPMNEKGELIYKHDSAGVLSMANSGKATNSSQFFITHKATPWLDGMHSVFGKVLLGQDIVDVIKQNDYINHVEIIRVGREAKKFIAANVFERELLNEEKRAAEHKEKIAELKRVFQEQKGINEAIETSKAKNVILLSGDRHISEFSKTNIPNVKYPIIDFTSSGLTHAYTSFSSEKNKQRVGNVISTLSYGVLFFDFELNKVIFQMRGKNNTILQKISQVYP